jgi:hypothetical protein
MVFLQSIKSVLEIEIHPISIARKQSNRVPIVSLTIVHLPLDRLPLPHQGCPESASIPKNLSVKNKPEARGNKLGGKQLIAVRRHIRL